jgi:hypothetical protein
MAGYDGFSKSNNALDAEMDGRYPLSRTKGVLAKALGITQDQARFILEKRGTREWHHTSSQFNMTNYYDVKSLVKEIQDDPDVSLDDLLAGYKKPSKSAVIVHENCTVKWIEWEGTQNHPRAIKHEETDCTVEDKGGKMVLVTLPNGHSFRKGKTTNGFSFTKEI